MNRWIEIEQRFAKEKALRSLPRPFGKVPKHDYVHWKIDGQEFWECSKCKAVLGRDKIVCVEVNAK